MFSKKYLLNPEKLISFFIKNYIFNVPMFPLLTSIDLNLIYTFSKFKIFFLILVKIKTSLLKIQYWPYILFAFESNFKEFNTGIIRISNDISVKFSSFKK